MNLKPSEFDLKAAPKISEIEQARAFKDAIVADQSAFIQMFNFCGANEVKQQEYLMAMYQREAVQPAVAELMEALRAIVDEAKQSNGGKGAKLPIVIYMQELAEAALSKYEATK